MTNNIKKLVLATNDPKKAEQAVKTLIEYIGEDASREGLAQTPERVVRAFAEHFCGYQQDPAVILNKSFTEVAAYNGPISVDEVEFISHCEHHMAPFFGVVNISYTPNKKVVGLSKLARVVDTFAKRLQLQERLTAQIAQAIFDHLEPKSVTVEIIAQHSCLNFRGANKRTSKMRTKTTLGAGA